MSKRKAPNKPTSTSTPPKKKNSQEPQHMQLDTIIPAVTQSVLATLKDMGVLKGTEESGQPTTSSSSLSPDQGTSQCQTPGNTDEGTTDCQPPVMPIPSRMPVQGGAIFDRMRLAESSSGSHSRGSDNTLTDVAQCLVTSSLSQASQNTYNRALSIYKSFVQTNKHIPDAMPITTQNYLFFIAYCHEKKMAASSVSTYISALTYVHKLIGLQDFASNFLVKKCLQGYNNCLKSPDKRLPITIEMLHKLLESVDKVCTGLFMKVMLKAMYLLAFHACLRIGEFTSNKGAPAIISYSDLTFKDFQNGLPTLMEVRISNFKHSKGRSVVIAITAKKENKLFCPVSNMWHYVSLRGPVDGPLFTFLDREPVTRSFFSTMLGRCLIFCGYDNKVYKGHSFRIGAASAAASLGKSESFIQEMGRWKSTAFKKYIRIQSFSV
ncbi:uncharacterized protein LOC128551535 [Mercenaria mercenaria]|uniref:uncharacterized protein LOC128551535 n=1 Tax=Mercenaria mercenaria TaxID=6596 RepID=UPI00234E6E40|nr:uncharacterized protein LOC128551535 [Mercenaria mercenaria]